MGPPQNNCKTSIKSAENASQYHRCIVLNLRQQILKFSFKYTLLLKKKRGLETVSTVSSWKVIIQVGEEP